MRDLRLLAVIISILAQLSLVGCADLDVANLNEPDRNRVSHSVDDMTALVSGSYNTWFNGVFSYYGPGRFLSQIPFQHSTAWPCHSGFYAMIPREAINNSPSDAWNDRISRIWDRSYRALVALSDGLKALDDPDITQGSGVEDLAMVRAFALFGQGLSHATVAAFYDRGFTMDETVNVEEEQFSVGYQELMEASLAYFDEAIELAEGADFTLPYGWMQAEVTSQDLGRIAHSLKAQLRAQVARTPAEREAVDWADVIADVDAGIQATFNMEMDDYGGWSNQTLGYATYAGWSQIPYFIYGMADQSGSYQEWSALPLQEMNANLPDGRPFLIVTPDMRFPQGTTIKAQREVSGSKFRIADPNEERWRSGHNPWRWSWYQGSVKGQNYWTDAIMVQPLITLAEMRLLKAEGLFRLGDRAGAAAVVNETRTLAGLSATDAFGSNDSCVPKLPDGSCGGLWEMLKWEKRMETVFTGLAGVGWWFDGRGWGDLWKDTPLQLPVPCTEMELLGLTPCYTFGGPGGEMGSEGSSYNFPGENLGGARDLKATSLSCGG
jgi:hypothetical protein